MKSLAKYIQVLSFSAVAVLVINNLINLELVLSLLAYKNNERFKLKNKKSRATAIQLLISSSAYFIIFLGATIYLACLPPQPTRDSPSTFQQSNTEDEENNELIPKNNHHDSTFNE